MNVITLPPSLLKFADGAPEIAVGGDTLEQVRKELESLNPSLYGVLFCSQGKLQPYVCMFIEKSMIDGDGDWNSLRLNPNSRIDILLAVAGG